MWVRVTLLRKKGEKLLADALRDSAWLEGQLSVEPEPERRAAKRGARVALLMPSGKSFEPLAQLFDVQLLKMERRGFVLVGHEEYWDRKRGIDYPQAWWCVPVLPHSPPFQAADLLKVVQEAGTRGGQLAG